MRYYSFVILIVGLCLSSSVIASVGLWRSSSASTNVVSANEVVLQLDMEQMEQRLLDVADIASAYQKTIAPSLYSIELPLPDGSFQSVIVQPTSTLSSELQQKFPNIRTYKIAGVEDKSLSGRIDLSPYGFHAMLHTTTGKVAYIDPVTDQSGQIYHSYWATDSRNAKTTTSHQCALGHDHHADDAVINTDDIQQKLSQASGLLSESVVYKYRLAVSATGEYTAQHGGTKATALAAIASTINRLNAIYERDAAMHFELVANNEKLIFTNVANDPFTGNVRDFLRQNQTTISNAIGTDNYDVGHLFTANGGGVAVVGGACQANVKAMGVSGYQASERFDLAFVAHELGHQFGATHTFNGIAGLCLSNNRIAATAYEPGSGSTIMSYAGICGGDNVQSYVDPLFHIGSIQQIRDHKRNQLNNGCGEVLRDTLNSPTIDAGADYVIPANTPFLLRGEIVAQNDSDLVYNWQQVDAGIASTVSVDTGDNALFRTFLPTASTQRSFPRLSVLLGEEQTVGETLPTDVRVMNFQFMAQDSQGMTVSDVSQIRVYKDGQQFGLATPNSAYQTGVVSTITWEVANTDLPPISCTTVDIALSLDSGHHFDTELASRITNTGVATIVIPNSISNVDTARFKLSCSDNIFFSMSNRTFSITNDDLSDALNRREQDSVSNVSVVPSQGGGGNFSILLLLSIALVAVFGRKRLILVVFLAKKTLS